MLHIVLLILKIIGIVLLCVLGLALLLILAVLFMPIHYDIFADYHDRFTAKLHITWLFHLLRVRAEYNDEPVIRAKLLFFTVFDSTADTKKKFDEENVFDEDQGGKHTPPKKSIVSQKKADTADEKDTNQGLQKPSETKDDSKQAQNQNESGEPEDDSKKEASETSGLLDKIRRIFAGIKQKIADILERIRNIFSEAESAKEKLLEKTAFIKEKLSDSDNQEFARFLWKQFKVLLKHIAPKKYEINIHFGFDDPEKTGKVLMYLAVLYGFLGIQMNITPEFEKDVKEGDVFIKGRIRVICLLMILFRLYRNKQFKKWFNQLMEK